MFEWLVRQQSIRSQPKAVHVERATADGRALRLVTGATSTEALQRPDGPARPTPARVGGGGALEAVRSGGRRGEAGMVAMTAATPARAALETLAAAVPGERQRPPAELPESEAPPAGRRGRALRSWGQWGRAALPLTVFSCVLGFGLYWVATEEGWLTTGWGPAGATVLLYLAGVLAVVQGLTWVIGGVEARAIRGIERDRPGGL